MADNPKDKRAIQPLRLPPGSIENFKHELFFDVPLTQPDSDTRFRKGQSGNPKGRPKKSRQEGAVDMSSHALTPSMEALLSLARLTIRIKENGVIRDVPTYVAVLKALIATASRGSAYALDKLLTRLERIEERYAAKLADEHSLFERYITQCRAETEAALKAEEDAPRFVPHPDDIILEPGQPVRIAGPRTEEEATLVESHVALRDNLILQAALEQKHAQFDKPLREGEPGYTATLLAFTINNLLPKRLRFSQDRMILRLERAMATAERQLLRDVRQGWRRLGCHARRGATLPNYHKVHTAISQMVKMIQHESASAGR